MSGCGYNLLFQKNGPQLKRVFQQLIWKQPATAHVGQDLNCFPPSTSFTPCSLHHHFYGPVISIGFPSLVFHLEKHMAHHPHTKSQPFWTFQGKDSSLESLAQTRLDP